MATHLVGEVMHISKHLRIYAFALPLQEQESTNLVLAKTRRFGQSRYAFLCFVRVRLRGSSAGCEGSMTAWKDDGHGLVLTPWDALRVRAVERAGLARFAMGWSISPVHVQSSGGHSSGKWGGGGSGKWSKKDSASGTRKRSPLMALDASGALVAGAGSGGQVLRHGVAAAQSHHKRLTSASAHTAEVLELVASNRAWSANWQHHGMMRGAFESACALAQRSPHTDNGWVSSEEGLRAFLCLSILV